MISKFLLILGLAFAQNSTYIKGPTLYESLTTIASTGGNTGITCSSNTNYEITGALTHTLTLPDATGCALGRVYDIKNNSTLTLTVRTFGGAFYKGVPSGGFLRIVLKDNSSSIGSWQFAQGVYPISISRDVITNFTAGSIPFSDGVTLSQNNAAFFWDNVNNRLGIGTNTPQGALEVRGSNFPLVQINANGSTYPASPANTLMHTVSANGATSRFVFDTHNSGVNGSYILGRHARGTAAAPTAVNNGDTLMGFAGVGYGTTGYASNGSGYMLIRAEGTFTDTSNPTNIQFFTTPNASVTPVQRVYVASTGAVSIGSSSPATGAKLDIQGTDGALLIPRVTTAQKNAIPSPAAGMTVYDTTLSRFECYTSAWNQCGYVSAPTIQKFTSGSGTYTTPSGVKWIRVVVVGPGGGGGGAGGSSGSPVSGSAGSGATTFGTSLLTANAGAGGGGGTINASASGGTTTVNAPAIAIISQTGGVGESGTVGLANGYGKGGNGGSTPLAHGIGGGLASTAPAPPANSGAGGGGGGTLGGVAAGYASGAGGGAGGYIEAIINSPSATYSYSIGSGGVGGAGGTGSGGGIAGANGLIIVTEYYQ